MHALDYTRRLTPALPVSEISPASLQGRLVIHLPTDSREKWERLGIEWAEVPDGLFLAKALLPISWRVETTFVSGVREVTIIDHTHREQAKIATTVVQSADGFQPLHYPEYKCQLYCSYEQIIQAIEPWGTVKAILAKEGGLTHCFVVHFKSPVRIWGDREYYAYPDWKKRSFIFQSHVWHRIQYTPFHPIEASFVNQKGPNYIASKDMIVFDIPPLSLNQFTSDLILETRRFFPNERIDELKDKIHRSIADELRDKIHRSIANAFSHSEKAEMLLRWIRESGLSLLQNGWVAHGSNIGAPLPNLIPAPTEDILRYFNSQGWNTKYTSAQREEP